MAQQATNFPFDERSSVEETRRFPRAAGLFMALFLATCLLLAAMNPALLESPAEPLLTGAWAAAYQQQFDDESLLFEPATTIWGLIEYSLFEQGRAGLLIGEEGWLFSTEEFAYPAGDEAAARNLEGNLDAIAEVKERLEERGVLLVVALLPAKARVYPEHLGRYRLPEGPERRYGRALAGLRERDVQVTPLLAPLLSAKESGAVFLRTDTHWTPYGARVAARAVAEKVAGLSNFGWLGEEEYHTSRTEPEPYRGDLTNFLPLGPFYDELGPEDDLFARVETTSPNPGSDLLGEVLLPVVLVGTSYSQDQRWNFPGWLRQELGNDVLVAAQQGLGPHEPMIEYLEGQAFRNAPPQVVVWEVPERYLGDRWK